MRVLKFILESSKPYRATLILMLLAMVGVAAFVNMQSYFIKLLVDYFAGVGNLSINHLFLIFIAMQIMPLISWILFDYSAIKINNMKSSILNSLLDKIKDYEITFFQDNMGGSLSTKLRDASNTTVSFLFMLIDNTIQFIFMAIIAFGILSSLNIWLGLLMLSLIISFTIISTFSLKRLITLNESCAESQSKVWGIVGDFLSNMSVVRQFSGLSKERKFLENSQKDYNKKVFARGMYLVRFYRFFGIFSSLWLFAIFSFIINLHDTGQVTTGDVAYIFTILYKVIEQLFLITHIMREQFSNIGTIKNALTILDFDKEIQDSPTALPLKVTKGEIVFDKVKFQYKGAEGLFQNKSVTIESGQKVGLVGYSGGGKTTFVNLVLRMYDVTEGAIKIDGQDIKDVTQDSLRSSIGMIPQDPSLFHRSLMDNIRYGKMDATDKEVIAASKRAHAHDFITKLPLKYESLVGERGVKLSGGQRQRIAIARALLKNAPILILDEATSQLDSVTEQYIAESLWNLMQSKTTIVIAHRLSTLLNMDRILVFDHGKIVEDGTHKELLDKGGLYKRLWSAQVGGFLPEGN